MVFAQKANLSFLGVPSNVAFTVIAGSLFIVNLFQICSWIIYAYEEEGSLQPNGPLRQSFPLSCHGMRRSSYHLRNFVETFVGCFVGFLAVLGVSDKCTAKLGYLLAFLIFVPAFRGVLMMWDFSYFYICTNQYSYNMMDISLFWRFPNIPISDVLKHDFSTWNQFRQTEVDVKVAAASIFGPSIPAWGLYVVLNVILGLACLYTARVCSAYLEFYANGGSEGTMGEFFGIQADLTAKRPTLKKDTQIRDFVYMTGEGPIRALENHPLLKSVNDQYCFDPSGALLVEKSAELEV